MNDESTTTPPGSDEPVAAASGLDEFKTSVEDARRTVRAFLAADRATKLRFAGDLVALVPLVAMLLWMSTHDGGFEPLYRRYLTIVTAAVSPIAALEFRALGRWPRRLLMGWTIGLLLVWALAGERNFWVTSSIPLVLTPAMGLFAHRLWRRPWGPTVLYGLLLLSMGSFFYRSFLTWWGDTMRGLQPLFRPLSWHNQSGALMGAFGAAFLGAAYASRSWVAGISVLAAGAGLGTTWLAGSRGAAIATAIGVVVVTVAAIRGARTRRVPATLVATGLAALVVTLGLISMEQPGAVAEPLADSPGALPTERISDRSLAAGQSFSRRLLHMDAAAGMFFDRPVSGQGIGSYRVRSLPFTDPDARLTSSAHNEYVEMLGEGGLIFGIPFLVLHALAAAAALRRRVVPPDPDASEPDLRAAVAAAGIGLVTVVGLHAAIDFDWFYPVLPALFAIGAVAVGGRPIGAAELEPRRTAWWGLPLVIGLVLVAGADLAESRADAGATDLTAEEVAAVPLPWQGERAIPIALDLTRADEHELAEGLLSEVIAWNPAVDEYQVLRASVLYRAGEIDADDLVLALADTSAQFRAFNLVAEAMIDEGDYDMARRVLDVVIERYERFTNWGVGGVRAESWYLVVRADSEAGACARAREDADEALETGAYTAADARVELDPLVASCEDGGGAAG